MATVRKYDISEAPIAKPVPARSTMNRKSMLILTGLLLLALASFGVRGSYSEGADSSSSPSRIERLLPNGWRVSPAGRQIALSGDLVLKMLVTPDGKYLLVN